MSEGVWLFFAELMATAVMGLIQSHYGNIRKSFEKVEEDAEARHREILDQLAGKVPAEPHMREHRELNADLKHTKSRVSALEMQVKELEKRRR